MNDSKIVVSPARVMQRARPKRARYFVWLAASSTWLGCQAAEFGLGSNDSPANMQSVEDKGGHLREAGTPSRPVITFAQDAGARGVNAEAANGTAAASDDSEAPGSKLDDPDTDVSLRASDASATTPPGPDPAPDQETDEAPDTATGDGTRNDPLTEPNATSSEMEDPRAGDAGSSAEPIILQDLSGCTREQPTSYVQGLWRERFSCPEGNFETTCVDQGSDWSCNRDGTYLPQDHAGLPYLTVSNAAGPSEVCDIASLAFQPGRQLPYSGPDTCETVTGCNADSSWCYENVHCGPALRIVGGVEVREGAPKSASCGSEIREHGEWMCSCSGYGPNDNTVYVAPGDLESVSAQFADFCRNPEPSTPTGPMTCESQSSEIGIGNHCAEAQVCLTEYQTPDGTVLRAVTDWYASCDDGSCYCYGGDFNANLDTEPTAEPLQACLDVLEICKSEQDSPVVVDGAPQDCQVRGEGDLTASACWDVVDCTRSGTLGEYSISVNDWFPVECDLSGASPQCVCKDRDRVALGEVEVEAGADNPCLLAARQCRDIVAGEAP